MEWANSKNRTTYQDIRITSESAMTASYYLLLGVLANHLVSAINASFLAEKIEMGLTQDIINNNSKFTLAFNL